MRNQFRRFAVLFLSVCCIGRAASPSPADSISFHHAYYLFLDGGQGCENCYVPLLITKRSLEEVAKQEREEASILIITYERDSIWHDDGIVSVTPRAVNFAERIIHLQDRKYRYQEIAAAEVVRLLKNPMGTIPISRPLLPTTTLPGPTLDELVLAFQR